LTDWPANKSICTHPGGPASADTTRGLCTVSLPAILCSVRLSPHLTRLSCTPRTSGLSLVGWLCLTRGAVNRAHWGANREGRRRHP
jgi:hypothetical protein